MSGEETLSLKERMSWTFVILNIIKSDRYVKDKIDDPYFIYFTDDPEYIQQNFDLSNGFLSVEL
jgi:hypothetical protein